MSEGEKEREERERQRIRHRETAYMSMRIFNWIAAIWVLSFAGFLVIVWTAPESWFKPAVAAMIVLTATSGYFGLSAIFHSAMYLGARDGEK